MENVSTLAERVAAELRAEMAWQGKDIRELATVINCSTSTAKTRFTGESELRLDEINVVSVWLGVDSKQLLTGAHSKSRLAS